MLNATSKTRDSEISVIPHQHDRKGAKTHRSCHVHLRHHNEEDGSERKSPKILVQSQYYVNNCHYCGNSHQRKKCPAFHKICKKCRKMDIMPKYANLYTKQKHFQIMIQMTVDTHSIQSLQMDPVYTKSKHSRYFDHRTKNKQHKIQNRFWCRCEHTAIQRIPRNQSMT